MEFTTFENNGKVYLVDLELSRFNVARQEGNFIEYNKSVKQVPATAGHHPYCNEDIYEIKRDIPKEIGNAIIKLGKHVYQAGYTYNIPNNLIKDIESTGVKLTFADYLEKSYAGGGGSVHPKPGQLVKIGQYVSEISYNNVSVYLTKDN